MSKLSLVLIVISVFVSCKSHKQTQSSQDEVEKPVIGMPMSDLSPDQARVSAKIIDLNDAAVELQIIKQVEVGHSFKTILEKDQRITASYSERDVVSEIQTREDYVCVIEKSPNGAYRLISITKN